MANIITNILLPSQKYLHANSSRSPGKGPEECRPAPSRHETMSPQCPSVGGNNPEMGYWL